MHHNKLNKKTQARKRKQIISKGNTNSREKMIHLEIKTEYSPIHLRKEF